jgi:hypothetical protein
MRIEGTKARRAAEGKRHLAALRGIASLGFSPSKYRAVRLASSHCRVQALSPMSPGAATRCLDPKAFDKIENVVSALLREEKTAARAA